MEKSLGPFVRLSLVRCFRTRGHEPPPYAFSNCSANAAPLDAPSEPCGVDAAEDGSDPGSDVHSDSASRWPSRRSAS